MTYSQKLWRKQWRCWVCKPEKRSRKRAKQSQMEEGWSPQNTGNQKWKKGIRTIRKGYVSNEGRAKNQNQMAKEWRQGLTYKTFKTGNKQKKPVNITNHTVFTLLALLWHAHMVRWQLNTFSHNHLTGAQCHLFKCHVFLFFVFFPLMNFLLLQEIKCGCGSPAGGHENLWGLHPVLVLDLAVSLPTFWLSP